MDKNKDDLENLTNVNLDQNNDQNLDQNNDYYLKNTYEKTRITNTKDQAIFDEYPKSRMKKSEQIF